MLSILAGAALGAYTLKSLVGLSKDVAVANAVKKVKGAVHEAISETKSSIATGFAEGVAKAKAGKENTPTSDDLIAKIWAVSTPEQREEILKVIAAQNSGTVEEEAQAA